MYAVGGSADPTINSEGNYYKATMVKEASQVRSLFLLVCYLHTTIALLNGLFDSAYVQPVF